MRVTVPVDVSLNKETTRQTPEAKCRVIGRKQEFLL